MTGMRCEWVEEGIKVKLCIQVAWHESDPVNLSP